MFKHILVGYDGGATARRAFHFAMEMAALGRGKVRVVTVIRTSETGGDTGALLISDNSDDRARDLLMELKQEAPNQAPFEAELVHGCPGDALLAQVAAHDIDHVVIGHSKRGALARWLLGSVSADLLSRAHVPVTIVR